MKTLRFEYGDRFNAVFKTITSDNGTEFERLSEIEDWGSKVYFAHPYSSWERPQNERHNRIFRRYVPKGTSIENYSAEQIVGFADAMNNPQFPSIVLQAGEVFSSETIYRFRVEK